MYPDILNYDRTVELLGDFKAPMGCRSFLPSWQDASGAFINSGRANLGVVTLNVPRIAIESGGDKKAFWEIFHEKMWLMHDALLSRVERLKSVVSDNAPILYKSGAFGIRLEPGEDVMDVFTRERCTLSMGYIGLYEAVTVFYGPDWEDDPKAKAFTMEILKEMKQYQFEWTDDYDLFFSVYGTPSE